MADPKKPWLSELKKIGLDPRATRALFDLFNTPDQLEEIESEINDLDKRVDLLEREKVTITTSDSPYEAKDSDTILCDMSLGPIEVQLPDPTASSVGVSIARSGADNELSVTGAIAKGAPMLIRRDNSRADMVPTENDWRP